MQMTPKVLQCVCGAAARNTTKERGRFLRRHPLANPADTTPRTIAADEVHIKEMRDARSRALARQAEADAKARNAAIARAVVDAAIAAAARRSVQQ